MRVKNVTQRSRAWLLGAALFAVAAGGTGCAAALLVGAVGGAAVGTAAYVNGEHSQVYSTSLDRTWTATLAALEDMNIRVESSTKDGVGGTIDAERADGKDVTIEEEAQEGGHTEVRIRIGTFGDRAASEAIQERIAARLG